MTSADVLAEPGQAPRRPPPNTRPACELDPRYALPHNNLADLLSQPEQARRGRRPIQEARSSSTRNTALPAQQSRLLFSCNQGKADESRRRLQEGDPARPQIRPATQRSRQFPRRPGQARRGRRPIQPKAIELDPKYAPPHYSLGILLRNRAVKGSGSTRNETLMEACRRFMIGAELAPKDPDYPAALRSIDTLLTRGQHCPPR